jgi:hypothetical protein
MTTEAAIYSVRFSRRIGGAVTELGLIRASLSPTATPAAVEAVAAKAAARQGIPVSLATERQSFRLHRYDPLTGAESWVPLSRTGCNGGDGEEEE